jgi:hypothetical protein
MHAEQRFDVTWSAVITRADGTVEDLGVVAQTVAPRRSLWERIRKIVKR